MSDRVLHDGAFATTQSIIDVFPNGYFGNDKAQVFYEIYLRVKAGIEATIIQADRTRSRLSPTNN